MTTPLCECQLIVTDSIRLCRSCHRYFKGKQEFTSVSKVIRTLLPTDYSAVDPATLEGARLRGVYVDTYFSEYLTDPANVVPLKEVGPMVRDSFPKDHDKYADDVMRRIHMLLDWWAQSGWKATAVQQTVYSETDGIAGTFDIATEEMILDLKVVSELQPSYALQIGAYASYDAQTFPLRDAGILHLTKEKVKLVRHDAKRCKQQWRACVDWYKASRELVKA